MRGVGLRGRARHRRARIGEQPFDQRDRPRRRGDELARTLPQPQAELQHVEGRIDVTPFCELVAPGGVELRAAQLLGVFRGKRVADGAVRPFQAPARRRPQRTLVARRHAQEPGRTVYHHLAHVVLGLANQRNVHRALVGIRRGAIGLRAHPLGAEPGLAGPTPAQHEPGRPRTAAIGAQWRLLMTMRERDEILIEPPHPSVERRLRHHRPRQSAQ